MRFSDRPIVTAGLGIAFALLLLAILTSPALLGNVSNSPSSSGPLFAPANANLVSSSNSGAATVSSSISSITTFTTTPGTSASSQSAGNSTISGSTGYSYPSTSTTGTGTTLVYTTIVQGGTTMNASSTPVESFSTTTPQSASTTTSVSTVAQQADTVLTTISTSAVVTNGGMPLAYSYRTLFSTKNMLGSLGVLSAVSLAIALGSMFYVRRKVNSEEK